MSAGHRRLEDPNRRADHTRSTFIMTASTRFLTCVTLLLAGVCHVRAGGGSDFFVGPNGVTVMCPEAEIGSTGTIDGEEYTKRTREQLGELVEADRNDVEIRLTCTSAITDMSSLFDSAVLFDQDIGRWDTGNVVNFQSMFRSAGDFNQDIGRWDTSKATNMGQMFDSASTFNQNISNWNTAEVTDMFAMFQSAGAFNQDLSGWCVSKVGGLFGTPPKPLNFDANADAWDLAQPNFANPPC